MRRVVACLMMIVAGAAIASDYPTDPSEKDKLCEEFGDARDTSAPPQDRLWFSENCVCEDGIGCGYTGSRRFSERRKVADQAEAKRLEAERKAVAERDAEDLKAARSTCKAYVACLRKHATDVQACGEDEARFDYDCSSGLRDFEACGQAAAAFQKSPADADCGSVLKAPKPGI